MDSSQTDLLFKTNWNDPSIVDRFVHREPDIHVLERIESCPHPEQIKVLDLGCGGGRNTEPLIRKGFQTWAVDGAEAMVRATVERVRDLLPPHLLQERICQAQADQLPYPDESFDWIAAIGVYHNAKSDDELFRTLEESRRVLKPGGSILCRVFAEVMVPESAVLAAGSRYVYQFGDTTACGFSAQQLEELFGEIGMVPEGEIKLYHGRDQSVQRIANVGWFKAT